MSTTFAGPTQRSSRHRSIDAVLIRPATPDDLPSIRVLEKQTESAAHWTEREYNALFAKDAPERIVLVALDNESQGAQIQGFVIARSTLDEWEIENVIVASSRRRLGMATRLIQELLVRARNQGATSVLLEVRESNLAAGRLYEKLGFREQGRRNDYYNLPTEDALVLRVFVAVS
jgi:ribosomal-protein-alanine N-acetyltransferase